jgi:hypothetical protein
MTKTIQINYDIRIVQATVNLKPVWRVYYKQEVHSEHPTQAAAFKKANTLKLINQ